MHTQYGEAWGISVSVCLKGLIKGFGLGKSLRKQDFSLDWMLSGNEGNSMIGYLSKSYVERRRLESCKW